MSIDVSVNFNFRTGKDYFSFNDIVSHFLFLINSSNELLKEKLEWYESGYSKKQALSHLAFKDDNISDSTIFKWESVYEKDFPLFVESVWDGKGDYSSGITYRKIYCNEADKVSAELNLVSQNKSIGISDFINLFLKLACHFDCSYINIESKGYTFFDNNVFPDRLSVGWMLYLLHIIQPELIPEAVTIVPIFDGPKQKGIIIVSTEEIFDGSNKDHISKANDIEIKLLDLGLLPLITEL